MSTRIDYVKARLLKEGELVSVSPGDPYEELHDIVEGQDADGTCNVVLFTEHNMRCVKGDDMVAVNRNTDLS